MASSPSGWEAAQPGPPSKRQKTSSAQQPHLSEAMENANKAPIDGNRTGSDDREAEVGILHFVNTSNPGFSGTLKMRYTDFLVNEVATDGTVVHLTDDKTPNFKSLSSKGPPAEEPMPAPEDESGAVSVNHEEKPISVNAEIPVPSSALESSTAEVEKIDEASISNESKQNPVLPPVQTQSNNSHSDSSIIAKTQSNVPGVAAEPTEELDNLENRQLLNTYFGTDLTNEIFKLYANILSKPSAKPAFFGSLLSEPITDRPLRGRIHSDIRRIFKARLETEAVEEGKIQITAARPGSNDQNGKPRNPNPRAQGRPGQTKGKIGWDELGGQFLHFTLYKENKDTMEVLSFLCRQLKVKPRDFAFAGTKDRRAATTQRVSVYRQRSNAIARLNPTLRNARLGNFKHEKNRLELGELAGNQFTITLRDCHFPNEAGLDESNRFVLADKLVRDAAQHLQADGFINYFGLQRFGTFGIGTDEVGKKILQGNFEGAVEAILSYSNEALAGGLALKHDIPLSEQINKDDVDRAHAIHSFKVTGKSKDALDRLPRKFTGETCLIRALSTSRSKDYVAALLQIPRNLRTMYVHAYQSRVWNIVASERWTQYGRKVIEGDLVLIHTTDTIAASNRQDFDENGEPVIHPAVDDIAVSHDDIFERARPLTAEEAESGKYTIYDIVLPTPGFDVEYPLNDIGDFYKKYMGSEAGGGLDPADMRRKQKDFSLSGSYRKLIATVAKDMTYEIKSYREETEQLVETDLEKLDKLKPESTSNQNAQGVGRYQQSRRGHHPHTNGEQLHNQNTDITRTEETKRMEERYLGTDAHNAWLNAPTVLAAQDRARAEAAEKAKLTDKSVDPNDVMQPIIQDTFIETSAANDGGRTGKITTVVHAAEGRKGEAAGESANEPGGSLPSGYQPTTSKGMPSSEVTIQKMEVEMGGTDPAADTQIQTQMSSVYPVTKPSHPEPKVQEIQDVVEPSPARIAVVLKFTLGVSQYATMALRELMKVGGVKTYKPDFSGAR